MTSGQTLIGVKFNAANHKTLWALREYHGYLALDHTWCDQFGRILHVTPVQADRMMLEAGRNIYVDVPIDPNCPVEGFNRFR